MVLASLVFNAPRSPRYFKPDGTIVRVGAKLHEHLDGTVMTKHSMGPNDNSVIVTTIRPGRPKGKGLLRSRGQYIAPSPGTNEEGTKKFGDQIAPDNDMGIGTGGGPGSKLPGDGGIIIDDPGAGSGMGNQGGGGY